MAFGSMGPWAIGNRPWTLRPLDYWTMCRWDHKICQPGNHVKLGPLVLWNHRTFGGCDFGRMGLLPKSVDSYTLVKPKLKRRKKTALNKLLLIFPITLLPLLLSLTRFSMLSPDSILNLVIETCYLKHGSWNLLHETCCLKLESGDKSSQKVEQEKTLLKDGCGHTLVSWP